MVLQVLLMIFEYSSGTGLSGFKSSSNFLFIIAEVKNPSAFQSAFSYLILRKYEALIIEDVFSRLIYKSQILI